MVSGLGLLGCRVVGVSESGHDPLFWAEGRFLVMPLLHRLLECGVCLGFRV